MLAYAIGYARDGFPMTPGHRAGDRARWSRRGRRSARALAARARGCATRCWPTPTSAWRARAGPTREARIDAARDAWYRGFVAEAIVRGGRGSRRRQLGRGARRRARRRRPGRVLGDLRGAGRRSTSAAGRCSRPGRGARGRSSSSSSRCSTGSSSGRSSASSTSTAWSSARSSRSPTARRGTATRRRCRSSELLSPAYADARRALVGRRGLGRAAARGSAGGCRPSPRVRGAARGRGRADARGHLPSRRRRPLGQPRLGHAERRLAAELARDRRPRLLPRHARADVLARGRAAGARWCGGRRPRTTLSPSLALRDDGTVHGVRHARRRPAGPVVARVLPRPRRVRARPAGGDRRADVPHDALPELVLSARGRAAAGRGRGARAGGDASSALRARGHDVLVGEDWVLGRLSAIARSPDGLLRGAANPRGMQGYAVGR